MGVVVISPAFIETANESGWTHYEMRGIIANSMGPSGRRIVPIWLDVNRDDVLAWSPPMADLIAIDACGRLTEDVALDLLRVIAPDRAAGLARMRLLFAASRHGREGMAEISELKPSPAQDRRVSGNVPLRALLVTEMLADCGEPHASDFESFLENLSRDLHHERELRLWEAIAASYAAGCRMAELDAGQRRALYSFLLMASMGMADQPAIEVLTPAVAGPVLERFQLLQRMVQGEAVIGAGGLRALIVPTDDP
jgi:hypothetical protein